MITFLVRHGDAGVKGSWDGPDTARPLSPAGLDQAEGLVLRLEDYPVERILCSPTVRCHQTVEPLARDRVLGIEPLAALGVAADPSEILELLWDRRLGNAVLCTHGENIGQLFGLLAGHGLIAPAPLVWPKGSAWLLHRTDRRPVHARYLSPLALDRQLPTVHPSGVMLMRGPRHRVAR